MPILNGGRNREVFNLFLETFAFNKFFDLLINFFYHFIEAS